MKDLCNKLNLVSNRVGVYIFDKKFPVFTRLKVDAAWDWHLDQLALPSQKKKKVQEAIVFIYQVLHKK